ncbi:MAG TPA: glycosyltransferase family 4 protein [Anaerolineae bacterium]|nr:glycosyltransferase family 4 protein [Anaerolineae bacterium]
MSRILFLTQILPYPLSSGAKIRQYYMLRHLARRHEVTLVSFTRADDPAEALEHLQDVCYAVHPVPMHRSPWRNVRAAAKGMLTGLPMVIARDEVAEMKAALRRLVAAQAFDVIHADQLSMAWWARSAARMAEPRRPGTVLDEHNAIYLLTRRMAGTERNPLRRAITLREARAFARYERDMCREFDAVVTVTTEDREHLLALFPPEERERLAFKITVVPICVDPEHVSPVAHRDGGPPTVLHLGTMFWPPNAHGVLWFAREVLPLIHEQVPEARFVVVGKNPPAEVQALTSDPRVQVTGYVADPLPYLESADAVVVPLHAGGGMRVKIVDAWLWGLPIVATPIGAEGIRVQDGENILLAEGAQKCARATVRLLTDQALNRRLRANGRAWVEAHYAWQSVYPLVDRVYADLLEAKAGQC